MDLILMMIALFAVMYFLMIRPQQKRMKQHQEMQSSLAPGARVLLTSGLFGTITNVGERQLIVELAPGVEVTVLKGNVARAITADEEEFEFTDAETDAVLDEPVDEADPTALPESTADDSFFQGPDAQARPEDTK